MDRLQFNDDNRNDTCNSMLISEMPIARRCRLPEDAKEETGVRLNHSGDFEIVVIGTFSIDSSMSELLEIPKKEISRSLFEGHKLLSKFG